ncbi:MAG: hypothetical protein V4549_06650 [Bacteroidota bacterium]
MKNLFISYYESKNPDRNTEIKKAIKFNLESGWVDRIFLLIDPGVKNPFHGQCTEIKLKQKPTFKIFFSAVNEVTNKDDLNIITNSDIIIDETIEVAEKRITPSQCYALSRWEMNPDMTCQAKQVQVYGDSQDAWIFKGHISNSEKMWLDFPMGKMGCDNRIAHEIKQGGYDVLNPAKSIKTWHLHTVDFREYDNQVRNEQTVVQPPYLTIPITSL